MQLISLIVLKGDSILREITFKDGINFITCNDDDGNQIGKSTTLRILNFCLGSNGDSIWVDPETNSDNKKIKDLVSSGEISFKLTITVQKITHIITRKFETFGKNKVMLRRLAWINESPYKTNDKFREDLSKLLGLPFTSPTFSQIKNRLVRLNKGTASNPFRYDNEHTPIKAYTLFYSYIFDFNGLETLKKELEIDKEIKSRKDRITHLLNNKSEQYYSEKLASLEIEIENLKEKETLFDFKDTQNKNLNSLRELRIEISQLSGEISNLEIKAEYTKKNNKQLY